MPYILNTEKEIAEMLNSIGASGFDEFYSSLDSKIILSRPLGIPKGLSEFETKKELSKLSDKTRAIDEFNSFLGSGCYDHYIPAAVSALASSHQFVTAYTPYQPECSQGILQAIYEYQSYICRLTGMDVSNASVFDGASSLAEAALMALRLSAKRKVLVCGAIHPEYIETLRTYFSGFDFVIEEMEHGKDGLVDLDRLSSKMNGEIGCSIVQSPNFFGLIENIKEFASKVKPHGALVVSVVNPLSLAILKEPGSLGVDIVCGDGQSLGCEISFGGPSFGFLAAKKEYLRQMPGKIVGKTTDIEGCPAYCLTLQTREQHIRREKATSNICSNQSHQAIRAAIYLSLLGKEGLTKAARYSLNNTQYLYQNLKSIDGVSIPYGPGVFNEFLWEVDRPKALLDELFKKKIIAGYFAGDILPNHRGAVISCCTEKKTKNDIDAFISAVKDILKHR
ncbi:MAG: aminomethyl-transferring glycine dehydrogenase subunit GcvPA [Candidatus Omnitrophota bacterium]